MRVPTAGVASELCLLRELRAPSKVFLFNLTYPGREYLLISPYILRISFAYSRYPRPRHLPLLPERFFQTLSASFVSFSVAFFVRTEGKKRLLEYEELFPQNSLVGLFIPRPFLPAKSDFMGEVRFIRSCVGREERQHSDASIFAMRMYRLDFTLNAVENARKNYRKIQNLRVARARGGGEADT